MKACAGVGVNLRLLYLALERRQLRTSILLFTPIQRRRGNHGNYYVGGCLIPRVISDAMTKKNFQLLPGIETGSSASCYPPFLVRAYCSAPTFSTPNSSTEPNVYL